MQVQNYEERCRSYVSCRRELISCLLSIWGNSCLLYVDSCLHLDQSYHNCSDWSYASSFILYNHFIISSLQSSVSYHFLCEQIYISYSQNRKGKECFLHILVKFNHPQFHQNFLDLIKIELRQIEGLNMSVRSDVYPHWINFSNDDYEWIKYPRPLSRWNHICWKELLENIGKDV